MFKKENIDTLIYNILVVVFTIATILVTIYVITGSFTCAYIALSIYTMSFTVLCLAEIRKLFVLNTYKLRIKNLDFNFAQANENTVNENLEENLSKENLKSENSANLDATQTEVVDDKNLTEADKSVKKDLNLDGETGSELAFEEKVDLDYAEIAKINASQFDELTKQEFMQELPIIKRVVKSTYKKVLTKAILTGAFAIFTLVVLILF